MELINKITQTNFEDLDNELKKGIIKEIREKAKKEKMNLKKNRLVILKMMEFYLNKYLITIEMITLMIDLFDKKRKNPFLNAEFLESLQMMAKKQRYTLSHDCFSLLLENDNPNNIGLNKMNLNSFIIDKMAEYAEKNPNNPHKIRNVYI